MYLVHRQVDEHGEQSPEMSLAVKLAFSRVSSLISSLKNDIGEEAALYQFQRIRNDVEKVLKEERNRTVYKENRIPPFSELDTTSTTVRTKGNLDFISQKKESAANYQQNNGTVSFFSSKNDDLCTSFSSSFRPMVRTTSDVENCVSLGTIVEESRFEVDESGAESGSEEQSDRESTFFFLKSWSLLLKDNEILLTGIKMNEKGEVLVKNFVSEKVISRKQKDTVRTLDGEYVLQESLVDKTKGIPLEVKNQYFANEEFPRNWRQALGLWIKLEEKKRKEEKSKKKTPTQKKVLSSKDGSARKRSISPTKKMKDGSARKKSISPKKKMKGDNTRKRSISPKKKMNDGSMRKKSVSPKKKMQNVQSKKEVKVSAKKLKSPAQSASKPETSIERNKKTNTTSKRTKKNKQVLDTQNAESDDMERNRANKNLENGQDEHGPFSELLGEDSLMIFPSSALTPNGLLGSIKKNVIKGRYTPPTSMFDNVYGTKSDNNSSLNTSFEDIGVKNNHVVKRMCKVNKKPKGRQNHKSPKHKHIMEEDEAINEILRAAKSKTNTTPSIIKQVFNADRAEDSVNFSDLSDVEVA